MIPDNIGFSVALSLHIRSCLLGSHRHVPTHFRSEKSLNTITGITLLREFKSDILCGSVFYLLVFSFLSIHDVTNQTQVFLLCVFYYTFPTFLFIDTEPFDHLLIHCHCPTQSLNERHTKSAAFYEWIYNIDVLECIAYLYSAGKNIYLYSNSLKKIVQSYSTPREGLCNSFRVLNKTDNPDCLN